jgi:serine/threonine protein kinase
MTLGARGQGVTPIAFRRSVQAEPLKVTIHPRVSTATDEGATHQKSVSLKHEQGDAMMIASERRKGEGAAGAKATLLGGYGFTAPAARLEPVDVMALAATRSSGARARTTVLPRRASAADATVVDGRPRFQHLRTLGEGAQGRVELVRDNDIRRTVAVKHLLAGAESSEALSRFAEEIRVIGQLEHPGIVPVYDVDRGDDGQVYLVMKHLQGETMEQIIEHLRAGDAAYVGRYTPEYRVRIFLGVLDAIGYAHDRGVLHRDLKPANIMIGAHGEVTVVDWGIAKPFKKAPAKANDAVTIAPAFGASQDARLLETQTGAVAGTPLYMSPEQAAGLNDELDERSDLYTLCVVLYEWLVLLHPMRDKRSVAELFTALVLGDHSLEHLFDPAQSAGVPMEYMWIIRRGLVRDRERRYQSVKEFEAALKDVQDGRIPVQCHITWTKNRAQRFVHWIDRHPRLFTLLIRGARVLALVAAGGAVGLALSRL